MVDPFSFVPEHVKERIHDAAVEGLARLADRLPGDKIPRVIRRLKSDGQFRKSFENAVSMAVNRFLIEYSEIDPMLAARLNVDQRFWSSKMLFDSLELIATKPGVTAQDERAKLYAELRSVLGADIAMKQIIDAVDYFIRCLSEEVWHLPELQPIYSLYMQRISAEHARITAEQTTVIAEEIRGLRAAMSLRAPVVPAIEGSHHELLAASTMPPNEVELSDPARQATTVAQYRHWLKEVTSVLDLREIGNPKPGINISFELNSLYRPLHVRAGPESYDPDQPRTPLETVIESTHRLLIIGDSGSGKSTLLRYLCRTYSEDGVKPTPILVDLVDFSDDELIPVPRRRTSPDLLVQVALRRLDGEGLSLAKEDLVRHADQGHIIWLLDGLNELPSPEAREAAVELVNVAARRWQNCKFLITSTPSAVQGTSIPLGFDLAEVDEWRPSDIELFLDSWSLALDPDASGQQRRERWEPLLEAILNTPELRSLAKNALNVTAMAVVHFNEHRLPDGRADLLGAVTSWLINHRRHVLRRSGFTSKQIDAAFLELAYYMAVAEHGPLKKVGKRWAANKTRHIFDDDGDKSVSFYETAVRTGSLLVSSSPGDLTFWNDSLRDYLAAKFVAGKTDDHVSGWWSEIVSRLDDDTWSLIITLVPGCLATLGTDRVDLFFERLGNSCTNQTLEVRARRVALGGRALRELKPSGYSGKNVSAWAGAITSIGPLFTEGSSTRLSTRYEAAVAFGVEGDSRLSDESTLWAWLPGGTFLMGSQSTDPGLPNYDRDAAVWESPTHQETVGIFAIRRFLLTVGEYRRFIQDDGYSDDSGTIWSDEGMQWRESAGIRCPLGWEDQVQVPNAPVTGVSWFEADAYCRWASIRSEGNKYDLPTEIEWEYAARRGLASGRQFPWGDRMTFGEGAEANWAGCHLRRKTPVGMFPLSTTRDGVADLFGNVEEWCKDLWAWSGDDPLLRSDAHFLDHHRPLFQTTGIQRVARGGSTIRFSRLCRPSYRTRILQEGRYHTVGFRPVKRVSE